jgi:acyl-CoA thioesterase II
MVAGVSDSLGSPDIAAHFALEQVDDDHFRSGVGPARPFGGLFGGQPLSLGLRAAGSTVAPDRSPHSLHAYFLRPGQGAVAMDIHVSRDSDGRSFSGRRVTVTQDGTVIFTMAASFHVVEDGPDEQDLVMDIHVHDPDLIEPSPGPNGASSPIEVRNLGNRFGEDGMPTRSWGRAAGPLPEDPLLHACALAHFSDLYTGLPAIPGTNDRGGPSLDHALWFHRPVNMNDWVLMDLNPVSTGRGRGHYSGTFFDRRGTLVATMAQEVLFSTSRPPREFPPRGMSIEELRELARVQGMELPPGL